MSKKDFLEKLVGGEIPKDLFQKRDFYPIYGAVTSARRFLKDMKLSRFAYTIAIHTYNMLLVMSVAATSHAGHQIYNTLRG